MNRPKQTGRRSTYGFTTGEVTYVRVRIAPDHADEWFAWVQKEHVWAIRTMGSGPVHLDEDTPIQGSVWWAGLYTANDAERIRAWMSARGYKERRGKGWRP